MKWSRLTPLKIRLRNAHRSAARHIVRRLTAQMLASSYIFISIHGSSSKGVEVNPPPQGTGMTKYFVCLFVPAATVDGVLTRQESLKGKSWLSVKIICRTIGKMSGKGGSMMKPEKEHTS